jgi:hypothetical protein
MKRNWYPPLQWMYGINHQTFERTFCNLGMTDIWQKAILRCGDRCAGSWCCRVFSSIPSHNLLDSNSTSPFHPPSSCDSCKWFQTYPNVPLGGYKVTPQLRTTTLDDFDIQHLSCSDSFKWKRGELSSVSTGQIGEQQVEEILLLS